MPDNERPTMWNGGNTNESKEQVIREWNKMIRASEDYFDTIDSEKEFREDLQERERLMKEQDQKNPIKSKFGDYNIKNQINKMMDKTCEISHGEPRNRYRRPEGAMVGKDNDNNE